MLEQSFESTTFSLQIITWVNKLVFEKSHLEILLKMLLGNRQLYFFSLEYIQYYLH